MVSTSGSMQVQCSLEQWDPPTEAQATTLALFHRSQARHPEDYPEEKLEMFGWKLIRNEAHTGFASVMVREDTGRIVSSTTVTPKRLWLGDREVPWAQIGDTFTDERFLRQGMFSKLVNATRLRAQGSGFDVVYGWPNKQSLPGYVKKLDFAVHPHLRLLVHHLPLSIRGIGINARSRAALAFDRVRASGAFRGTARAAIRVAGRVVGAASRSSVVSVHNGPADGTFDRLWADVKPALRAGQVRDRRFVQWRFVENPVRMQVFVLRDDKRLRGYLVYATVDSQRDELRRGFIVDWLFAPGESIAVGVPLLGRAVAQAMNDGVDRLTALQTDSTPILLPLRLFGFIRRDESQPVIIHRSAEGQRVLDSEERWHMTLAEGDTY